MAGTALLAGSQIVDEVVQLEASRLVSEAHDRQVGNVTMTLEDGTEVLLQKNLARFIVNLVESIAADGTLTTNSLPEELSTTVAAQVIGVSRPTLMKMIARNELPTKRSAHTLGFLRSDVLEFRAHRQGDRVKAVEDLRRAGDAFD